MNRLFLLFIVFTSCWLSGQQVYSVWYDADNGLPQNTVKDIVQDKYGFIWMSTENGLVKYDGYQFKTKKDITPNSNRYTYFRGNKKKDSIYVINYFQEDIVLISKMNAKRDPKSKYVIYKKRGKNIYYDFAKNGLDVEDIRTNHIIEFSSVTYLLHNTSIATIDHLGKENIVVSNLQMNYKDLLFCIDETLYMVSKKDKKIIKITHDNISFLNGDDTFFDEDANLYWSKINNQTFILKNNILYQVILSKNSFYLKKIINYDFDKEQVSAIFYDGHFQKIFIGTLLNGLNILKINNFRVLQKKNDIYYSLQTIEDNKILCPNGDIFSLNGFVKKIDLKKTDNYFLYKDKSDNIYTTSDIGLSLFYKKENYNTHKIIFQHKTINYFSKIDDLWCISFYDEFGFDNFLAFYKDDKYKVPIRIYDFDFSVNALASISKYKYLIGTKNGLFIIDLIRNKRSKVEYKKEIQVRDIIKTKDGNLWVMTYGDGFFLYKNHQLTKMPLDNNGRLSTAHSLQEDNKGFFWISSNEGLFKVKKSALLDDNKSNYSKVHYYRYTKHDGFYTNEFNGGCTPSSIALDNGYFAFPSMKGIVVFNPNNIKSYYPKNFYINTITFYDQKSNVKNNTLYLSNNFYKTEIYIDVPYFANNDNLVLEAKIDHSKNNKWEKLYSRKFLIAGLDPGEYQLKIRALSSDKGDYIYKNIKINVEYLFYQTILFKIVLVIVIVILVLIIIKLRIRKQQLKNFELERIIEIRTEKLIDTVNKLEYTKERLRRETKQQQKLLETISHDVITPAKYLSITTKKLYETDEKDYHKVKQYFEVLYKSSEEFYNFIKTLKDYAEIYRNNNEETEEFSLNEIVESKILLFEEIAKANNTAIHTHFKRNIMISSNKNVINIIIHNLIDNAVKNTKDGFIDVFVEQTKDGKIIIIKDSGNGMTDEQIKYYNELLKNNLEDKLILQKYGLGLHLVLQLLMMIDGELQLAQNYPKGTTAIINIKNISYE